MAIRHQVRDLGLQLAPGLMGQIVAWRSQRLIMRQDRQSGRLAASQRFVSRYGPRVLRGPFQGMRYPEETIRSRCVLSKLVGAYEAEIADWVEMARYPLVVNVGSADGYYAVGFALRGSKVIAFDTDPWARRATARLAEENGVAVEVRSLCTSDWLRTVPKNSLLFLDCEGAEAQLLDPRKAPALLDCDIIFETHDHRAAPGSAARIIADFADTHSAETATVRVRDGSEFPELDDPEIVDERRHPEQGWVRLARV